MARRHHRRCVAAATDRGAGKGVVVDDVTGGQTVVASNDICELDRCDADLVGTSGQGVRHGRHRAGTVARSEEQDFVTGRDEKGFTVSSGTEPVQAWSGNKSALPSSGGTSTLLTATFPLGDGTAALSAARDTSRNVKVQIEC